MHARFVLNRIEDESGISGTGIVAEGVAFSDGLVVLHWGSSRPTTEVFHHDKGIDELIIVHGHNGKTLVEWIDEEPL